MCYLVPYKITLTTGNHAGSGTKGPVLMNIVGPDGVSTGWLYFQNQAGNTSLPAGSQKTFAFSALALPEVIAIEVGYLISQKKIKKYDNGL